MRANRLVENVLIFFVVGVVCAFAFQLLVTYGVFLDEMITSDTPLWEYQAFMIAMSIIFGIISGVR